MEIITWHIHRISFAPCAIIDTRWNPMNPRQDRRSHSTRALGYRMYRLIVLPNPPNRFFFVTLFVPLRSRSMTFVVTPTRECGHSSIQNYCTLIITQISRLHSCYLANSLGHLNIWADALIQTLWVARSIPNIWPIPWQTVSCKR